MRKHEEVLEFMFDGKPMLDISKPALVICESINFTDITTGEKYSLTIDEVVSNLIPMEGTEHNRSLDSKLAALSHLFNNRNTRVQTPLENKLDESMKTRKERVIERPDCRKEYTRLNPKEVEEIEQLLLQDVATPQDIISTYQTTISTISRIKHGKHPNSSEDYKTILLKRRLGDELFD